MAEIKVTRGGCGISYTDANGTKRHTLKTAESGPFACDDAQAERLVRLGVAVYVDEKATQPKPEPKKASGYLDPVDLEKWEYNDLKKLAADMGLKPKGQKKADYIAAIAAAEVEIDEDDSDDDLPDLNAADPE